MMGSAIRGRHRPRRGLSIREEADVPAPPNRYPMFLFFSNHLGLLGSIAVSVVGTLVLLIVLGVIF
jgi:hypothetical protein